MYTVPNIPMLADTTYVLSSLAQHVGFFAGQPAFSQALKRSSLIWDELSSPKTFFRFTVLGECHFALPSMVNTNSSYTLLPSFVVKQCLAFWTESGNHRLILSVHGILDLRIISLVKKRIGKLLIILITVVIHNVIILLQSIMILTFEWAGLRHELSKKLINNTEPMLCALINPLSPNGDQTQFSPNNIHRLSRVNSLWELIKWSQGKKSFIFYQLLLTNSSRKCMEINLENFVCGY